MLSVIKDVLSASSLRMESVKTVKSLLMRIVYSVRIEQHVMNVRRGTSRTIENV